MPIYKKTLHFGEQIPSFNKSENIQLDDWSFYLWSEQFGAE